MRCAVGSGRAGRAGEKGGLETTLTAEVSAEAERLIGFCALDDFQAFETEARRVALQLMGQALARNLNADHCDEQGSHLPCECGAEGRLAGRRPKTFTTALGPLTLERAWYHCERCHHGFSPRDRALGIYGSASEIGERWARMRREELDEGRVDEVIAALRSHAGTCEEARKNAEYFSNNRERMNYPTFRAMGLCVATGVVEGGCKHIVGARLKHGGMRWTVAGANAIIALRCAVESNRFDDFWERRVSTRS